jgi:hypothetical protein
MEHFTLDNTEGYTVEQLDIFNELFEYWAEENGYDVSDYEASGKFFDEVMIHGERVLNVLDYHLASMLPESPNRQEIKQEKEIFLTVLWPAYMKYKRENQHIN